jgi:sigma-B regulation protein RsbU (phosphoserine phosphatase)
MEKILLVDDEPDFELLVKQKFRTSLSAGDFNFLFSHSGDEALERVQNDSHIAVVISDINMPGMDGLTLLHKIRAFNPMIKTIVISAYGDVKMFRAAMNAGAFDFITKPIDFQDLRDTINRALSLYRDSSALAIPHHVKT